MGLALRSLVRACGTAMGLLGAGMACGAAAQDAPAIPAQTNAQAEVSQALYLALFVNGRDLGLIVHVDRVGNAFYVAADELSEAGIRTENLPFGPDRRIALDAIPNLRFVYRSTEQRIDFTLPNAQLKPESLGYQRAVPPRPTSGTGFLLNYAANFQGTRISYMQSLDEQRTLDPLLTTATYGSTPPLTQQAAVAEYNALNRTLSVGTQLSFFSPIGIFVNSGYTTLEDGQTRYLREDTYWSYSSIDSLLTYTAGDFISSSLTWSRSLRMGGFSIASDFAIRPDLVTFPVPALGGTAVVPTTVDLYINQLRQYSGQATGGPFIINTAPALTGAGQAQLVYRDELGREVTVNESLYVDSRLLETGLSQWSLEVGYPRNNYGINSFDYASSPVASGSWRYGASDIFTLESHAEFAQGLHNLGIGSLFELGHWGVLNGSVTVDRGDTQGTQASLGYQYTAPYVSVNAQAMRTYGDYRDLGNIEGVPVPRRELHASVSVPIGVGQNISLAYARQDASILGGSRITSLGYSGSFGSRFSVFANLFKDRDQPDSGGIYIGLIVDLGDRTTVSASASRYGDTKSMALSANHAIDYDTGGFGWNVLADGGNGGYRHQMGRLDYQGTYGDLSAQIEHSDLNNSSYTSNSLYAAGSLVFMDGSLLASRPISDAFAVVSTDGTPDVPVLRENRLVGTTNSGGHLLVPDLLSYDTNHLAIDTLNLPVEANVETDHLDVAPRAKSGVLVRFAMGRYEGATVILKDEQGQPLPVGTHVTLDASTAKALVGYDGQVFFPALQPGGNKVSALMGDVMCTADVRFRTVDTMKTIGPFVCKRTPKP
jgi:outer membrane usher protein